MEIVRYIPYEHIYIDKKIIKNKKIYSIFYKEKFSDFLINKLKYIGVMVYNSDLEDYEISGFNEYLQEHFEKYYGNDNINFTIVYVT
jgi:hypothetical protein